MTASGGGNEQAIISQMRWYQVVEHLVDQDGELKGYSIIGSGSGFTMNPNRI